MTLKPLRSVAADANVLLGACMGAPTRRVFSQGGLEIVTTEFNLAEVAEYLPRLAARWRIPVETYQATLGMLPLVSFPESGYVSRMEEAKGLIADPDDIHLAALALKLGVPVWSNDRDFERFPGGVYTTARLLKVLGL